jgi:hypothetical protein
MKKLFFVLLLFHLSSYDNLSSRDKMKSITEDCKTGCFGVECGIAPGTITEPQVDCYNIWTKYTLRIINGKPQWTSGRYGSNFYDNNAIDGNCYTCELGSGKFSPGAVQNWQGPDGSFSRYICRVVKEGGKIHAKWVFIAKCN